MNILYRKAALPILSTYVYKYGCTYPHSHFPHLLLSRIYTPWYTWPAGQQPKRPEETRRSLLDWNSPLTKRIYHPNYHESSFPKPFLSLKKRQRTIRRIIKDFSIGIFTYVLETDIFSTRKCELAHKHLRNGNGSVFMWWKYTKHFLSVSDVQLMKEWETKHSVQSKYYELEAITFHSSIRDYQLLNQILHKGSFNIIS